MSNETREVHCLVGPPESGKSYQARLIFGRFHRALAITYDVKDRYPGRLCQTFNGLTRYVFENEQLFRAVYQVADRAPADADDEQSEFNGCCELALLLQQESLRARRRYDPFCYLVEEITIHPDANDEYGIFSEMCREGRHQAISLVATTQYPGDLPLFMRTAMTHYHFFQTVEVNALEFVRKTLGSEAMECVRNLPQHVALVYDRRTKTITPPLKAS